MPLFMKKPIILLLPTLEIRLESKPPNYSRTAFFEENVLFSSKTLPTLSGGGKQRHDSDETQGLSSIHLPCVGILAAVPWIKKNPFSFFFYILCNECQAQKHAMEV